MKVVYKGRMRFLKTLKKWLGRLIKLSLDSAFPKCWSENMQYYLDNFLSSSTDYIGGYYHTGGHYKKDRLVEQKVLLPDATGKGWKFLQGRIPSFSPKLSTIAIWNACEISLEYEFKIYGKSNAEQSSQEKDFRVAADSSMQNFREKITQIKDADYIFSTQEDKFISTDLYHRYKIHQITFCVLFPNHWLLAKFIEKKDDPYTMFRIERFTYAQDDATIHDINLLRDNVNVRKTMNMMYVKDFQRIFKGLKWKTVGGIYGNKEHVFENSTLGGKLKPDLHRKIMEYVPKEEWATTESIGTIIEERGKIKQWPIPQQKDAMKTASCTCAACGKIIF